MSDTTPLGDPEAPGPDTAPSTSAAPSGPTATTAPSTTTPPTSEPTPPASTVEPPGAAPAAKPFTVSAYGIEAALPPGWEGRIAQRAGAPTAQTLAGRSVAPDGIGPAGSTEERSHPIAHLANFPLPENRGDFGSGAVDVMGSGDVLVVLFEYGPEAVGQPLFARRGLPTDLKPNMFSRSALQRTVPGQAGCQVFFTENGRAFCAYVVLGRQEDAARVVPLANETLRATRILPR